MPLFRAKLCDSFAANSFAPVEGKKPVSDILLLVPDRKLTQFLTIDSAQSLVISLVHSAVIKNGNYNLRKKM